MQGLVEAAGARIDPDPAPELLEVMLLADLQKIEHFEIAAYGAARAHAEALGLDEAVELLDETLNEGEATDALLNRLATEKINPPRPWRTPVRTGRRGRKQTRRPARCPQRVTLTGAGTKRPSGCAERWWS
jgi:hypothetical protein